VNNAGDYPTGEPFKRSRLKSLSGTYTLAYLSFLWVTEKKVFFKIVTGFFQEVAIVILLLLLRRML
jgi:hypothetical protein